MAKNLKEGSQDKVTEQSDLFWEWARWGKGAGVFKGTVSFILDNGLGDFSWDIMVL